MIDELFNNLNESVFTPEMKESLKSSFNEAVELKALEKIDEKLEEKISELDDHCETFKQSLEEEYKNKENLLTEKMEEYLELVVDEFLKEAKDSLDIEVDNKKCQALVEAFSNILETAGVDLLSIKNKSDKVLEESKIKEQDSVKRQDETINFLLDKVSKLEEENKNLLKLGLVNELKEGLTVVEAEKFDRLADLVENTADDKYLEKLTSIKNSVKGSKSETMTESKTVKVENTSLNENMNSFAEKTVSFEHLL